MEIARAHQFHSLGQDQSTVAQRVKTTVAAYSLTSCVWARFRVGSNAMSGQLHSQPTNNYYNDISNNKSRSLQRGVLLTEKLYGAYVYYVFSKVSWSFLELTAKTIGIHEWKVKIRTSFWLSTVEHGGEWVWIGKKTQCRKWLQAKIRKLKFTVLAKLLFFSIWYSGTNKKKKKFKPPLWAIVVRLR